MFIPGLVSITFRQLAVPDVIDLVKQAKLQSIEWGGDVHVPHGKLDAARSARQQTEDAGLTVAAYGSYYRVGKNENDQSPFGDVLDAAAELNAPTIRVWAGGHGSDQTAPATRRQIVSETQRIATLAAEAGISISFEFHGNTLTDTNESAIQLLEEINHPNVFSLWQPAIGISKGYALEGLHALLPKLTNIHVFSWMPTSNERLPLAAGTSRWRDYLDVARSTGRDHHILMEFVQNDSPEVFLEDAAVLRQWLTISHEG